jgi:hypothetical protein
VAPELARSLDAALIKVLNSECFCVGLDANALRRALFSDASRLQALGVPHARRRLGAGV